MGALAKKLQVREGQRVLVLGAPQGYAATLAADAPASVQVAHRSTGTYDVVQLFVTTRAAFHERLAAARKALKPDGVLWVCWPKQSAHAPTDLTRDVIRGEAEAEGMRPVAGVAVDETWSALRLKPL
ncbi:MAG TPA: DUF3052 domain-containing protein [Dehalococcoidia bacterium]|nr:DUF3052 domain-containing protein [Dehalococcoidia bacterium]